MDETHNQAIRNAVDVLNRIHSKDRTVLPALIFFRTPCNDELVDDETVQCSLVEGTTDKFEVGFLGVLNGIFGIDEKGWGYIYAHFDDEKNLTHFSTSLEE
jgi:hypothetical protein